MGSTRTAPPRHLRWQNQQANRRNVRGKRPKSNNLVCLAGAVPLVSFRCSAVRGTSSCTRVEADRTEERRDRSRIGRGQVLNAGELQFHVAPTASGQRWSA